MRYLGAIALLTCSLGVSAQRVSDLPAASALGGTEMVIGVQGGVTKRLTPVQIDTYISATTKTLTGKTISGAANTITNVPAANVVVTNIASGSVSRALNAKLADTISVKDFGAVGDGATDDTAALNAAFAIVGKRVWLPYGNYRVTSNLAEPVSASIVGEGASLTKITAAAGVTNVIKIGTAAANLTEIRDLSIYGNATASAIGVIVGNNQLAFRQIFTNFRVFNFTGTNAIGVDIRDAVTNQFNNVVIEGNYLNLRVDTGAETGTPTTTLFIGGGIRQALTKGCQINQAAQLVFQSTVFEGNTNEGCYVGGAASRNVIPVVFRDCWFEGNWGSDTSHYQLVIDGTAMGSTVRASVDGGYFSGSGATAKSIQVTGAGAAGVYLNMMQVPNLTGQISLTSSATVTIGSLPSNLTYTTVIADSTGNTQSLQKKIADYEAAWTAWTPTITTFGSMTFTGVTVSVARYRLVGKTLSIELKFAGTTGGTASAGLTVSLPTGTPKTLGMQAPCIVSNTGTWELGVVSYGGGDGIYIYRATTANYSLGANTGASVSLTMELQ